MPELGLKLGRARMIGHRSMKNLSQRVMNIARS